MRWSIYTTGSRILWALLAVLINTGAPHLPVPAALAQPVEQRGGPTGPLSIPPIWGQQQADSRVATKLVEEGISAYQQGQYDDAVSKLTQARSFLPTHSPTALYLGLAYLRQGKTGEAIAIWRAYTQLPPYTEAERTGGLPTVIPQYLTLLEREENHRRAREAVAGEQQLRPGDPRTLAVTYYRNLGAPELSFLQKGLTALLINDLSQVRDLRVVERDRLQALLEELQLGSTGLVNQDTAPKVGRLLGAGKVATGAYAVRAGEELQTDSVLVESATGQMLGAQSNSGKLQRFYELEKGLALAILKDLGYDEQQLQAAGVLDVIRRPQTTSLAALTAYSNGLDAKDRGAYGTARTQLQQALRSDPNFTLAQKELSTLPVVALTSGGIVASVQSSAPPASTALAGLVAPVAPTAGGTGGGLTLTKIGIGALVLGGAGAGVAVAVGGGGGGNDGPICGNNRRQGREQCDGSDLGGATCPSGDQPTCRGDCTLSCPTCGNGQREGQEQCDDGNMDNTDGCLNTCQVATCGDGFVRTDLAGLEECDDANTDTTDACVNCMIAECGDGFIQAGVEICDTGAAPNGCPASAACDATCTTCS